MEEEIQKSLVKSMPKLSTDKYKDYVWMKIQPRLL